jgi:hypothetical protein
MDGVEKRKNSLLGERFLSFAKTTPLQNLAKDSFSNFLNSG